MDTSRKPRETTRQRTPGRNLLHALNAAAAAIQKSARSEDEVFQAFSDNISRLGLMGIVSLFDEDHDCLVIRASGQPAQPVTGNETPENVSAKGFRFHLRGTPYHELIIEKGESVYIENWQPIFAAFFSEGERSLAERMLRGIRGYGGVFAPLKASTQVIGMLAIFTLGLTEQDELVVQAFANHVAIALENAALFENLRQAENRYRNLFDSSTEGIVIIDQESSRLISANKKIIEMFGYSMDELVQVGMSALLPPEYLPEISTYYQLIQKEGTINIELRLRRKDGSEFISQTAGSMFAAGSQKLFQFRVVDITAQKQMEADLLESEERFRSFFQQATDGIMLTDEQGVVIEWNSSQEQITGIPREEAIGQYVWDVQYRMTLPQKQTAEYYEQVRAFAQAYLQSGGSQVALGKPIEHQIIARDGTLRDVQIVGFPVGTPRGFRSGSITRDVGEMKRLENALTRRAKALRTLHDFSLDLNSARELPSLLQTIVERATHLLDADSGAMYTCDPARREITCVVSYLTPEDFLNTTLKYGEGAAGTVAGTGQALIVNHYSEWEGRVKLLQGTVETSAVLSVPLRLEGRTIGVLQIINELPYRGFNESDQELLTLFADQAVVAFENTRLLNAEQQARTQAETLQEATRAVNSSLDLTEVLSQILHQLARLLHFDISSVLLYGEQGAASLAVGLGYQNQEYTSPHLGELLKDSRILAKMRVDSQPVNIPDVYQCADWIELPGTEAIRSFLGIPIIARGEMIGSLFVSSYEVNFFSEKDLAVAEALAQQMAVAIANARLYRQQEQRAAELQAVHQASLSVTSSLELEGVFYAILTSTLELLPDTQNAHIFLYHADEDLLTFGAALWTNSGKRGEPVANPRRGGLTYNVARSGEIVVVPDIRTHPLYAGIESVHPDWLGALIGIPLKIGKQVVGVMNVAYKQPRQFPETELRILRLLGDQAAIAIENARLYEQASGERRHISLLYDISRMLSSSLDPDTILNLAIQLTQEALGGLLGEAYLYQPDEQKLSLRAMHGLSEEDLESINQVADLKPGKGLTGWVLENDHPALVADVLADSRWFTFEKTDADARAAIACPIPGEVRPIGVLMVLHQQPGYFTRDHLDLLQGICQQVGLALANAQRYQQVQDLVNLLAGEQDRLVGLIEGLPVGVALLDREHYLMITNSLAREMLLAFGYENTLPKVERFGDVSIAELAARQNDPVAREIVLDGPPQRVFTVQVRQVGPGKLQWVLILADITRERETQLRSQMQERLATVGQLAAGIAHDFNNIMAAILVYTDLLMQDMNLYPAGRERLNVIRQQVQRAASLIRQILDFSRRSVMEQSSVDLMPFLKELHKLLNRVLPESVHLELVSRPGCYLINADPTRMQQVFMNLALNACDAMPAGGILRFDLDRVTVPAAGLPAMTDLPAGEWVKIEISDTGAGIPAEVLPHIFEPFYTTKPVGQGTGLGLAQVYGIVKQHNGYIDAASQPGVITTFTIFLPAQASTAEDQAPDSSAARFDGGGRVVLPVEDDQPTREAIHTLLEVNHFKVLTAPNGVEALRMYARNDDSIALVVSDVVMPMMGGVELYRSLQAKWPAVKMLLVTGFPLDHDGQQILEKGMVNWLQKPFSVTDFLQALELLIGKGGK